MKRNPPFFILVLSVTSIAIALSGCGASNDEPLPEEDSSFVAQEMRSSVNWFAQASDDFGALDDWRAEAPERAPSKPAPKSDKPTGGSEKKPTKMVRMGRPPPGWSVCSK